MYIYGKNPQAIAKYNSSVTDAHESSYKTKSQLTEIVTDVSVRSPFGRSDYESFRRAERLPKTFVEKINSCRTMYYDISIVRNVIDLMIDFVCEDFTLSHPEKKVEALFRYWVKKIKFYDTIEEYVKHLVIDYNVVVRRVTANVDGATIRKAIAKPDIKKVEKDEKVEKNEIPWRYMFLDVTKLNWTGGELGRMAGNRGLSMDVPREVIRALEANTPETKEYIKKIPSELKKQIESGKVSLDMSKTHVMHVRKDTWQDWADPFLSSIVQDILYKQKLRQAELSAIDGILNVIRIWKLGDHKIGILPDIAAISKLSNIIASNTGGGSMDIIWDSMIEMVPHYPPVNEILDPKKYDQVNKDILIGLGVPEVLLGGHGANFSNSFIQLKTLVEKLKGYRNKAIEFIEEEVGVVCEAFGIKERPTVSFSQMNLDDENVTKKLILNLWDRKIISTDAVLEVFGKDFPIEVSKIALETEEFKKHKIEPLSPLDAGQEDGEVGRPPATKDVTREKRTPKPTRARFLYALDFLDGIDEYIIPGYMENEGVSNARKLTNNQKGDVELLKVHLLSNAKPDEQISKEMMLEKLTKPASKSLAAKIDELSKDFFNDKGVTPTVEQRKVLYAMAFDEIA